MRIRAAACLAIALAGIGCAGAGGAQVRLYGQGLRVRIGAEEIPVEETLLWEWGFAVLHLWDATDPDVETVLKNDLCPRRFTRRQAEDVFAARGAYRVLVLLKPLGQETIRPGSIGRPGLAVPERLRTIAGRDPLYVRVVFRDGKLVHYTVWS